MSDDDAPLGHLVAAARDGDETAWNGLVERFTPLLITVLLRYRLPRAQSDDVAQTVWLRLVEHLDDLRDPKALPMWLITTAKREAERSIAVARRAVPSDPHDDGWEIACAAQPDPATDLIRSERHEALLEAFAVLAPRQRELLLMLCDDPPVAYVEISRRLGIPVGAIGPTRARALERLRRAPALARHLVLHADGDSSGRGAA